MRGARLSRAMTSRKTTPQRSSNRRANASRSMRSAAAVQQRPPAARGARTRAKALFAQPSLRVAERSQRIKSVGRYQTRGDELPQAPLRPRSASALWRARFPRRTAHAIDSIW